MKTLLQDLRYGLRQLRKSPGFSFIAILTLALGIGANSTIFSWVNSTILNPIPGVQHASQYVEITGGSVRGDNVLSYPDYQDLRDRNRALSSFIAASPTAMSLTANAKPQRVWGILTSANYFDALGVHPILGRAFLSAEDTKPGGAPVVVISNHLWQTRFGSDPSIVGTSIEIDRHPFEVIGVAPRDFVGTQTGLHYDLWVPLAMADDFYGNGAQLLQNR
ncbi:MAG TPA: ABC transporter permease, partial [Candidatus Acidoferrum sp.]|nr:ABC transporter permease [Candidatus Acidoferrum sp.]